MLSMIMFSSEYYELEVVGIAQDELVDDIDLFHGGAHSVLPLALTVNVD